MFFGFVSGVWFSVVYFMSKVLDLTKTIQIVLNGGMKSHRFRYPDLAFLPSPPFFLDWVLCHHAGYTGPCSTAVSVRCSHAKYTIIQQLHSFVSHLGTTGAASARIKRATYMRCRRASLNQRQAEILQCIPGWGTERSRLFVEHLFHAHWMCSGCPEG